jgi:predicted MFS family arabinose efflux permease
VSGIRSLRWWIAGRAVPLLRGPDPQNVRQRNIWHLYQDLVWLGLASAASTYINVYAIRLGASKQLIGIVTSMPALMMVLLRIPAAQAIERSSDSKSLIVRSLTAGRFLYLLLFLLPWLARLPVLRGIPQATLLVWLVIVMGIPSVLSSAGWDTFFANIVPEEQRARVVSMRNTLTHLITLTIVPLMGSFLDWAAFPFNYQVIFLVAFIGALISTWHVNRIRLRQAPLTTKKAHAPSLQEIRDIVQGSREFSVILLGTFVYQCAISLSAPLFTIYFIETLGASDSWIGWRTTLASVASIAAYRFWPRQVERRGEAVIIALTTPMMALYPLLMGLSRSLTVTFLIVVIPNLFGAAVLLSRYNILLRASPADRRPTFIAVYAILVNVAAFIAPLVGVGLAERIGMPAVFFMSAALRLVAGAIYSRLARTSLRAAGRSLLFGNDPHE